MKMQGNEDRKTEDSPSPQGYGAAGENEDEIKVYRIGLHSIAVDCTKK
jgi:hypothetical protein